MAALRARFIERSRGELAIVEAGPTHPKFRRVVHGLAGAAGMFGFDEVTRKAAVVDDRMAEGEPVGDHELAALLAALRAIV